jgi:hypothetical protein
MESGSQYYFGEPGIGAIMRPLIGVLLLCQFSFAQAVKVRVVNANNGNPLPKQAVSVQFLYEKPPQASPPLRIETDAHGEAQFSIPDPPPKSLDVRLALTSEHWHCGCWVMADPKTAIDKGFVDAVQPNKAKASTPPANPAPGQILFVVRPYTFFEKLLYPLIKG